MVRLLAFDFGATSGRGITADFDGEKIIMGEEYRFDNRPVYIGDSFYWDFPSLLQEMKLGIARLAKDKTPDCMGIDTWGVDYGLLDKTGQLIGIPYHYRDARTDDIMDEAFAAMSKEDIYNSTGIQFMGFNTIFQLFAHKKQRPWMLEQAERLLFMPDLLNYFLTGKETTEFSVASTGQLVNPYTYGWAEDVFEKLGLPRHLMTDNIEMPGKILGNITEEVANELGVKPFPVAIVAGHDTGSAVAAVPAKDEKYAYLSCGTWSLLGIESTKPLINEQTAKLNFTNEGGVGGTFRVLKNIMGLWIKTECLRYWKKNEKFEMSYKEMGEMIFAAEPFKCFIDPDDPIFEKPGRMPEKIVEFCKKTGQYVPQEKAEFLRCIEESLAMKYRYTIESIESFSDTPIEKLHIVGGGCQSETLCRFTSNVINRPVVAGPSEGTALGNLMCQLIAIGVVKDLTEARKILLNSVETIEYTPEDVDVWEDAYQKFVKYVQ